jgi:hypothetical protein
MKKTLLVFALIAAALGAFGVGIAFAQGGQPPVGQDGYGWWKGSRDDGRWHYDVGAGRSKPIIVTLKA